MFKKYLNNKAFTLIEIIIVIGLFSILITISTLALINSRQNISLGGTLNMLTSDIKVQQIKAMSGFDNKAHGIYISDNSYTLFSGDNYNENDLDNIKIYLDNSISIDHNLTNSQIIFEKSNGEVKNYTQELNIQINALDFSKSINITSLGVIDVNN